MCKVDRGALAILARYAQTSNPRELNALEVEFDTYMQDLAAGKKRKSTPTKYVNIIVDMSKPSPFAQAFAQFKEAVV